jgi:hypothetical protein
MHLDAEFGHDKVVLGHVVDRDAVTAVHKLAYRGLGESCPVPARKVTAILNQLRELGSRTRGKGARSRAAQSKVVKKTVTQAFY